MAKAQRQKRPAPPSRAPEQPPPVTRPRRVGWIAWLAVGVLAAGGAFWTAKEQATGGGEAVSPPAHGLPHTPDYHSLLVDAHDPERVLLGTHVGIYETTNGGVRWRFFALEGKDAMHLAREDAGTIWAAGHNVLEKSDDGGRTWSSVHPDGLPGLDIHGFALGSRPGVVYAAVAGDGLYRSDDGGERFHVLSKDVGPAVNALVVTGDGTLFAADGDRGVLVNSSGDGRDWRESLDMTTAGLAANRLEPPRTEVLAAGAAIELTSDGNRWQTVLEVKAGAGPVAFAPSDADIAYAVGFDRTLYRSNDGGRSWARVS